jgi:DNA-binding transcriptional LysR family regulator
MGRLVAPFSLSISKGGAWYLVHRPFREGAPVLIAFREWLRRNFRAG